MRIEISNPNDTLDKDFGEWLCKRLSFTIKTKMNYQKLNLWSQYLTESKIFIPVFTDKISAENIFIQASNNLVVEKFPSLLCIEINRNIYTSGLDRVKLKTAVDLITFGNQEQKGYPLILNQFKYVVNNINEFIDKYADGVLAWL